MRLPLDPVRLDLLLAAALTVAAQLEAWPATPSAGYRLVAALLALSVTSSVALRRRWPLATGVVAIAAVATELAVVDTLDNIAVAIAYFCVLYAVAVWTSVRRFLAGVGTMVAADLAIVAGPRLGVRDVVPFILVTVVVMVLVRRVIGERERRLALAEREREVAAREAVVAERTRIARELHDVVAHSVSVMVVQAQAGPRLMANPERVTSVFGAIETAGREALVELRRLLGVLRGGDEQVTTAPQPGLAALESLIEQVSAAGLPVALRVEGVPVPLPLGVDLSAYRIVQEALTNTLKHAGRSEAEVVVRYEPAAIELQILDNGTGIAPVVTGAGHGLIGMRERIALYGGRLEFGGRNGHGFAVRAHLPLQAEPAE